MRRPINSIADLKRRVKDCGSHFFDRDTMRFFNSRIGSDIFKSPRGVFFVTSEKGPDNRRRYTVRQFGGKARCSIKTVGKFQKFRTAAQAKAAARRLAIRFTGRTSRDVYRRRRR